MLRCCSGSVRASGITRTSAVLSARIVPAAAALPSSSAAAAAPRGTPAASFATAVISLPSRHAARPAARRSAASPASLSSATCASSSSSSSSLSSSRQPRRGFAAVRSAPSLSPATLPDAAPAADATPPVEKSRYTVPPSAHYDLVVIGSGPSGQKCAISAAKKKKRVLVIDRKAMLGGVCVHTGTIPSKTFREAILYFTGYRQRGFYGKGHKERANISSFDILDRVNKVVGWETETIVDQLARNRVETAEGAAHFLDEHHLEIVPGKHGDAIAPHQPTGSTIVRGDKILIACGSRPVRNPRFPFEHPKVFDSDRILESQNWDNTRELLVVGSGVIAMEYASMFNSLPGCRVTIIDEKPSFLDFVDHELVSTLRYIMSRQGATFRMGEKVKDVVATDRGVEVVMESGNIARGDALFYAVGRQVNTDRLALENTRVQCNPRGLVKVNQFFQTSAPHIYATGDVIGFPALASTAMEQGRLASLHMFDAFKSQPFIFPYGIYTCPEISVIGKSEQDLQREKIPYAIGIAKFSETAKGQMIGQDIDGFLKLLFDPKTKTLLGCHAIGESAAEIIHIGQAVLSYGGSIEYFRDSVFNYPTMAETYRIAALDGLGKLGIH